MTCILVNFHIIVAKCLANQDDGEGLLFVLALTVQSIASKAWGQGGLTGAAQK